MEVLLDVSGFKLEDTDKKKIDEYLKTLNNGNKICLENVDNSNQSIGHR